MHRIETATHVALLDPMTGVGVLALPRAADDLHGPAVTGLRTVSTGLCEVPVIELASLHEADWDRMVRKLDALGWEPTEGEDGEPASAGVTASGRELVGLYGRESVASEPSLEELVPAESALREALS